jgi:dTDP-4-amino-4,6-dideoxygalactose transaminase
MRVIRLADADFIPYALPDIGEDEQEAVRDTLASGWVTTGPNCRAFEEEFAAYLGSGVQALAVNSATSGLHLALEALGIGPGDEVIAPTLTFTATTEIVRYLGADPVLADILPHTLNIDPEDVKRRITPRTKAIIVVHYGGLACDMDAIWAIASEHSLKVVEDAAHAFPTTYQGELVGTLKSDITVFSFYANKTITTGEGGMVVSRHQDLMARMRIMRLHGISRDAFDRFQSKKPAWHYEVVAPGFKYNMTDVAAAMGRVQLRRIGAFLERREQLAQRYFEGLKGLPLTLAPHALQGDTHAWHIFAIRLHGDGTDLAPRAEFIDRLAALGIGTSVHYIPLHRQPYWRDTYGLSADAYPQADLAYHNIVSLPLYTKMTDGQQDRVIDAVGQVLSNVCV